MTSSRRQRAERAFRCSAPAIRSPTSSCSSTRRRPSELQEGVAFYGRAGNALLKSLQRLHVDPMAIYGTNCLKFAGGDEDESRPFLLRELHIVQPKLVVAMGEPAVAFLNAAQFPLARELDARRGRAPGATRRRSRGSSRPTSTSRSTSSRRRRRSGTPSRCSASGGARHPRTEPRRASRASASPRSSRARGGGRDVGRRSRSHLDPVWLWSDGRDHRGGRAAGDAAAHLPRAAALVAPAGRSRSRSSSSWSPPS